MRIAIAVATSLIALASVGCSPDGITVPRYVLSYGVSNYPYGDHLDSPAFDAQKMQALLVSDGYTDSYPDSHTGARIDSAVKKARIRDDILGLASLESDAIVVIFYSSHGTYDDSTGTAYLVPYDGINAGGYAVLNDCISPAELNGWIAQSGKRNVILIVNTCYSGGFVDSGAAIDTAPQNYGPNDMGTTPASGLMSALGSFGELLTRNARESGGPGPIVISASGSNESTYEYNIPFYEGHAIFPYYLIKAAESGDTNDDGFVTTTEAYQYAVAGIKLNWNSWAPSYYGPEQDRNQGNIYIDPDFMPHISGGARDLALFER